MAVACAGLKGVVEMIGPASISNDMGEVMRKTNNLLVEKVCVCVFVVYSSCIRVSFFSICFRALTDQVAHPSLPCSLPHVLCEFGVGIF